MALINWHTPAGTPIALVWLGKVPKLEGCLDAGEILADPRCRGIDLYETARQNAGAILG